MREIKLSPKQWELIEKMGVFGERSGSAPAISRVSALLIVCDELELTFEEIYQTLKISKSAASNAINALLSTEHIEYITKPGDRKRYFRSRIGNVGTDFENKFNKMLQISGLLKEILEIRNPETVEYNEKLKSVIRFMEFLKTEMPVLYEKWKKINAQ